MKLFAPLLVLAIVAVAAGCSSSNSDRAGGDGFEEEVDSAEAQLNATCKYPRRFAAFLHNGEECSNVAGARGEWVATPAFEDAPAGACTYEWSGEKRARVDRDAIRGYVEERDGVLSMMCGGSASDDDGIDPAYLEEIPGLDFFSMAGTVGCDVCGIQRNGRVWIVIPPERETHGEFQIPLSNGQFKAFKIRANQSASVMSVKLPSLPAGVQYVSGPIQIL